MDDNRSERCDDYEYDEAHDMPAQQARPAPAPAPCRAPEVNAGAGGDYGYDEAHRFGTRR